MTVFCFITNCKKATASAQCTIKRFNFLIYFYIAPGNFSLLAQRKVAENSPYGIRYL